jgi:hypothetical protein
VLLEVSFEPAEPLGLVVLETFQRKRDHEVEFTSEADTI